jgi:hypothetical protein
VVAANKKESGLLIAFIRPGRIFLKPRQFCSNASICDEELIAKSEYLSIRCNRYAGIVGDGPAQGAARLGARVPASVSGWVEG